MVSSALRFWQVERAGNLDQLVAAHRALSGTGPGRRWTTEQVNRSLVISVASEFQGFCRDLHNESSEQFADWASGDDPRIRLAVITALTSDRQLDRVNAKRETIARDFARLGVVDWWADVQRNDSRTLGRLGQLERLNKARNAIAHANDAPLKELADEGYPLRLAVVLRWRRALNGLTVSMNKTVAETLGTIFGRPRPW